MSAQFTLIIPAAGEGRRLAAGTSKAFVDLGGRFLIQHTMKRFDGINRITERIVAVRAGDEDIARRCLGEWDVKLVRGGPRRRDSVGAALARVEREFVVIHDAARPFVSAELIDRVLDEAERTDAAIAGIPLTDTIKRVARDAIMETVPRRELWAAQTPQAFRTSVLRDAFEKANSGGNEITDDAQIVEMTGRGVRMVLGESSNMKITTNNDLEVARFLCGEVHSG